MKERRQRKVRGTRVVEGVSTGVVVVDLTQKGREVELAALSLMRPPGISGEARRGAWWSLPASRLRGTCSKTVGAWAVARDQSTDNR